MSALGTFFLGSSPAIVQCDLLEITHPAFTQTYRIVRNFRKDLLTGVDFQGIRKRGMIVTHEGGAGPFEYEYVPAQIKPIGSGSDLGQTLSVTIGDLGVIIQKEIAAVTLANQMNVRPVVKFRTYRSDDKTQPIFGPLTLEISKITCAAEGSSFDASAPYLNASRTGELYTRDQFPMLAGFFI